ncbi:hypothetical protein P4S72_18695 [Vibrio sp. PP-XX7]
MNVSGSRLSYAIRLLLANGADRTIDHRNLYKVNALRMAFKGKPFVYDVIKLLL